MTEIYFVRHAEAEGNAFRRLHGQFDSLITPNGYRQLEALSRRFAPIHIDACYASDLTRTCITAGAIYQPKGLMLHKEPAFREISVGTWEDIPFGWLYRFEQEKMVQFNRDPLRWQVDGSEPFMAYTGRFLTRLEQLAKAHDGQTIAVVSHGSALRGVLLRLFFDPSKPEISYCDNTAVSHIFYENGRYTYEYLNDNSHLTPEISTLTRQKKQDGALDPRDYNLWYQTVAGKPEGFRQALRRDTPVGEVAIEDDGLDACRLTWLELKPQECGRRYGVQLLGEAVSMAKERGKRCLRACISAENEKMLGFLIHHGCQAVGQQDDNVVLEYRFTLD